MTKETIIQEIINRKKAKTYLEIGTGNGDHFLKIRARRKIAVDPDLSSLKIKKRKSKYYFRNITNLFNQYYEMTSDDFFKQEPEILQKYRLDFVFIDGLHSYEQALKDVLNSLRFLKEDGVIIMHDCNPASEAEAHPADSFEHAESLNLPGWNKYWCGDVWKTIVHLRANRSDLNIFVLDCDMGLGVITRAKQKGTLKYSPEEIKNLSYKDLEYNREKILNLKSLQYFKEFLNKMICD
jgi:SAM-dependent methyltransferase